MTKDYGCHFKYEIPIQFVLLLVWFIFIGCDNDVKTTGIRPTPPPPKPTIRIDQVETNLNNSISVWYINHNINVSRRNDSVDPVIGIPHVVLNDIEQIQLYKKEVQFLLKRLEEVEEKMTISETGTNGPKTTSP